MEMGWKNLMLTEHSIAERARAIFQNNTNTADTIVADPTTRKVERPTIMIKRAEMDLFPLHHQTPFGLRTGAAHSYKAIPQGKSIDSAADGIIWRIELHGLARNAEPLGFDVLGDAVLGRAADGSQPVDIALDDFGAAEQGMSRHHAMLRPTRNCLYLLDLNSTNGTFYNAMRLGCGVVHSIKNDDTIMLGDFAFQIRIIDRPSMH
jgi:hypothetical protein